MKEQDLSEKYMEEAEKLGQSKRQEVLDMIKSGKTLGEVSKFFNIDLMITCEIFIQNIKLNQIHNMDIIF